MDERYNRVSTIITTNLEPPDWYELFQKKSLVDALLDRLQHHCITIRIAAIGARCRVQRARARGSPVNALWRTHVYRANS